MIKKLTKEHRLAIVSTVILGFVTSPLFFLTTILIYFNKIKYAKFALIPIFLSPLYLLFVGFGGLFSFVPLITAALAYYIINKISKEKQEIYEEIRKTEENIFKKSERGNAVNNNLASKYSVLRIFQMIVGFVTIVHVVLSVQAMIEMGKYFKGAEARTMISLLLLQIFMSICLILMVNFLFDLNNSKSDKLEG